MKQLLNINNLYPKKSLGQNFIQDKNFLKKINSFISSDINTDIIEVGPGKGALTDFLSKKDFANLYLIEKDNVLSKKLEYQYLEIKGVKSINADALYFDYNKLNSGNKTIIVSNLPFNISTQLFLKWVMDYPCPPFYSKMILMFQKEVAERIISSRNQKSYSRISVIAQARFKIKKLLNAPANIFFPVPKVDGLILEFIPRIKYKDVSVLKLQIILKKAFELRRKKLRTSLKEYTDLLNLLGIDENLRAENLSVDDYCNLALAME